MMGSNKLAVILGSLSLLIGIACSGERDERPGQAWEPWDGDGGADDGADDGGDDGGDDGDDGGASDEGTGGGGGDDDGDDGADTGGDGGSDTGADTEDDCADYRTVYPAGPYGTSVGSVLADPPGMVDGNGTPHDFFEIYQDTSKVALVIVTAFET